MDVFRLREIAEFGLANAFIALLLLPLIGTLGDPASAVRIAGAIAGAHVALSTAALLRRQAPLRLAPSFGWYGLAAIVTGSAFTAAVVTIGTGGVTWLEWTLLLMLARPMLAFVFVLGTLRHDEG